MKYLYWVLVFITLLIFVSCNDDPVSVESDGYGWQTTSPENQNINSLLLESAFLAAEDLGYIDGLLIIRNGYIVAERYYNGFNKDTPHNNMSVSKSFLSLITGKAFELGYITNLDESILNSFPEYIYPGMDARKYNITIRHLLTMRMGIAPEADNYYALYQQLHNSSNWTKATIELPLIFNPGEKMRYNTFETHLLSAIITKKTGRSILDFAAENLFNQMKINVDQWERDPQGYYFGGNSMYFTPREMAVLGLVYLNSGRLNGVQIVPEEWIELSLTKTITNDSPEWGALKEYNYGYLWWLGKINGYKLYMALGYGGQFVLVFPELDLIVVATSNQNVNPDVDQERPVLEVVSKYVLPAVRN